MMDLVLIIKNLRFLGDRYDPLYLDAERMDVPLSECVERAQRMLRNKKIVVGGSHTRPLQAFALRECGAQTNKSGRSVTVEVASLLEKFPTGKEWYDGTNRHNQVTFSQVYAACMRIQPWEN